MATDLATLGLAIDSQPAVAAASALDKVADSAKKVDAANAAVAGSQKDVAQAVAGTTTVINNYISTTNNYAAATRSAATAAGTHTRAVNDNAKAVTAHGTAMGNANIQMMEATHIVKSLAEQFLAGVDPIRAFAMEGGRITTLFQLGGGVAGTLRSVGSMVGGLVNPFTLATGAATAFGAAIVTASAQYRAARDEMSNALVGRGGAFGISTDQGLQLARSAGNTPGVLPAAGLTPGTSRDATAAAIATGRLSPAIIPRVLGLTKGYSGSYGTSDEESAQQLVQLFADPTKALPKLDEKFALGDQTEEAVKNLQAQGDLLGAQEALYARIQPMLDGQVKATGTLDALWQRIVANNERYTNAIGRATNPLTPLQAYRMAATQEAVSRIVPRPGDVDYDPTKDTSNLAESVRQQGQLRAMLAQQVNESTSSSLVGGLLRDLNPATQQLQQLDNRAAEIAKNLGNLPFDQQGNAKRAMDGLATQAAQMRRDLEQGGTSFAESLRQAAFAQRTVGYSPGAMTSAQINEEAAQKSRAATLAAGQNTDRGQLFEQLQSIELERVTKLQTAQRQGLLASTAAGGGLSLAPASLQPLYLAAQNATGVDANLLAAQSGYESSFNPTADAHRTHPESHAYGLMQLQPGTARAMGVNLYDPAQNVLGGAMYLQQQLQATNGDVFAALARYKLGPAGFRNEVGTPGQPGYDISRLDPETRRYAQTIMQRAGNSALTPLSTAQDLTAQERTTRAANDNLANLTTNYGRNAVQLQATTQANQELAQAQQRGTVITDGYRRSITDAATAQAQAAQSAKLVQFTRDNAFQTDQIGRNAIDQQAYSAARSTVGDTTSSAAQLVESQTRYNLELQQTKSLSQDAFGSVLSSLRQGSSLTDALSNSLGRIADKLTDMALDNAFSALFKGGSSSAGGGLTSLLASTGIFGGSHATGGWISGPGTGTSDSILARVSTGEFVVRASAAARNREILEAINDNGAPRFASGGWVGGSPSMQPAPVNISVVSTGTPQQVQSSRTYTDNTGQRRTEVVLADTVATAIQSPQAQKSLRQQRVVRA